MLCIFRICLNLTFIYSLRQAALAVMAVTSCSFHQACLSLCCSFSQLSSHFSLSLQFSLAFSLHNISPFPCLFINLIFINQDLSLFCFFKQKLQETGVCKHVYHAFGSKSSIGLPARTGQADCAFHPKHPIIHKNKVQSHNVLCSHYWKND